MKRKNKSLKQARPQTLVSDAACLEVKRRAQEKLEKLFKRKLTEIIEKQHAALINVIFTKICAVHQSSNLVEFSSNSPLLSRNQANAVFLSTKRGTATFHNVQTCDNVLRSRQRVARRSSFTLRSTERPTNFMKSFDKNATVLSQGILPRGNTCSHAEEAKGKVTCFERMKNYREKVFG